MRLGLGSGSGSRVGLGVGVGVGAAGLERVSSAAEEAALLQALLQALLRALLGRGGVARSGESAGLLVHLRGVRGRE